jgi:hypothetical protein
MAVAATYEPVATYTIPSNGTTSYTFNSIPQTYTDLVVVVNGNAQSSGQNMQYQFNGNSSAIYSLTFVRWNGTSLDTTKVSSQTKPQVESFTTIATAASTWSQYKMHIMNYTNSSYYKAMLVEAGQGNFGADITTHVMQSTSPVTSLTLYGGSGGWTAGTTMTIYGILRA